MVAGHDGGWNLGAILAMHCPRFTAIVPWTASTRFSNRMRQTCSRARQTCSSVSRVCVSAALLDRSLGQRRQPAAVEASFFPTHSSQDAEAAKRKLNAPTFSIDQKRRRAFLEEMFSLKAYKGAEASAKDPRARQAAKENKDLLLALAALEFYEVGVFSREDVCIKFLTRTEYIFSLEDLKVVVPIGAHITRR